MTRKTKKGTSNPPRSGKRVRRHGSNVDATARETARVRKALASLALPGAPVGFEDRVLRAIALQEQGAGATVSLRRSQVPRGERTDSEGRFSHERASAISSATLGVGVVVAEKYRLVRFIGQGCVGEVWRAVNQSSGVEVALKLLHDPTREVAERFLQEVRSFGQIRHTHIVRVIDVGQTALGAPFLVMELLSGETLSELLRRIHKLDVLDAIAIGRDIARALAAAHAQGVAHRDLKPANIFLHRELGERCPVVKVLDFCVGQSLLAAECLEMTSLSADGSIPYMSPERACDIRYIDGRTDIWSLGAVLFEMLTGERPFEADDGTALSHVPPSLEKLVMSCLAREARLRPWPADEIASKLESILAEERCGERPASLPQVATVPSIAPFQAEPSAVKPLPYQEDSLDGATLTIRLPALPRANEELYTPKGTLRIQAISRVVEEAATESHGAASEGADAAASTSAPCIAMDAPRHGMRLPVIERSARQWWQSIGTFCLLMGLVIVGIYCSGGRAPDPDPGRPAANPPTDSPSRGSNGFKPIGHCRSVKPPHKAPGDAPSQPGHEAEPPAPEVASNALALGKGADCPHTR